MDKVVLSRGVFQNRLPLELMKKELKNEDFKAFKHSRLPCNDTSISLGQIAVASRNVYVEVIKGKITPYGCPQFRKNCNSSNPLESCMISFEGTCRIYYMYENRKEVKWMRF